MFMNLQPTPYDLNWRMFGFPVRVHPTFWLMTAMFAWPLADSGIQNWLIGIACMLVSLLAHELAHAMGFRYFGLRSGILCYGMGGLTVPNGRLPRRGQRIAVTLAGPFANFLLAGLVWASNNVVAWQLTNIYTATIYLTLFDINLYWGLLNLLPIYPLDGGQVSRELWLEYRPRTGVVDSLKMSFAVAVAFAVYALGCHFDVIPMSWTVPWLRPGLFVGILFAILAAQNYVELQNFRRSYQYYDDSTRWR